MAEKQMRVLTFMMTKVDQIHRKQFKNLMEQWHGGKGVLDYFYDIDVLEFKKIEAIEKGD